MNREFPSENQYAARLCAVLRGTRINKGAVNRQSRLSRRKNRARCLSSYFFGILQSGNGVHYGLPEMERLESVASIRNFAGNDECSIRCSVFWLFDMRTLEDGGIVDSHYLGV